MGLLTALVLRERGFERVALVSRNSPRAALATTLGIATVLLEKVEGGIAAGLGGPSACVFECAGSPAVARLAVEIVRLLGQVMLVGIALEPHDLFAPVLVLKKARSEVSSPIAGPTLPRQSPCFPRGWIPTETLITGTASLDEAEGMFQMLTSAIRTPRLSSNPEHSASVPGTFAR